MSDAAPTRPRQVTVAAWLIILGSVFVVVSAFGQVSAASSLETRERVEALLAEPPADGLGLSVGTVLELLRVVAMVAAATATATAILGTQVLKHSRAARLWLSVLAVPLFLSAAFIGGFMGALVAAAVVMLWLQPARAWFAGEPLPERFNADGTLRKAEAPSATSPAPQREHQPVGHAAPPPHQPHHESHQQPHHQPHHQPGPVPYAGFGDPQAGREQAPGPVGAHPGAPQRRPAALSWACALTWVGSGLVSGFLLLASLSFAVLTQADFEQAMAQQPDLLAEVREYGWDSLAQAVYVATAVGVVWSIVASVLAALAFRGVRWARVALTISTGVLAGVLLTTTLGAPLMVLVLLPIAAAFVLLLRPGVRSWRPSR